MDVLPDFLRAFLALAVVVLLMLLVAWGVRRFPQLQKMVGTPGKRMEVTATLLLDARHRLVLVKIDEREKAFVLSPETAVEVQL